DGARPSQAWLQRLQIAGVVMVANDRTSRIRAFEHDVASLEVGKLDSLALRAVQAKIRCGLSRGRGQRRHRCADRGHGYQSAPAHAASVTSFDPARDSPERR